MLRDLDLAPKYRSDRNVVARDFHVPCLEEAVRYDRAVGYFTSSSLSLAARGLDRFIRRGGRMRLVASPHLLEDDVQAIREGYQRRDDVIASALRRELTGPMPDAERDRLGFLAWMVAAGTLDIKVALVDNALGLGIYHEKLGLFTDEDGNRVSFEGSANESAGGLQQNFESVVVFRSWLESDRERVEQAVSDFELLWEDETDNLSVVSFPEAAIEDLLTYRPTEQPAADPEDSQIFAEVSPAILRMPADLELRPYQREAIQAWFSRNGRGSLEMATGSGKTLTALALLTFLVNRLKDARRATFVVVVCPFKHLVDQWASEARRFGVRPILCYEDAHRWVPQLSNALRGLDSGAFPFAIAVTTNATFSGQHFQAALEDTESTVVFVGDEAHNLGALTLRRALPAQALYRLGLSATPERHLDPIGTAAIVDYFGPTVFEFGLNEAIELGYLTPYDYHPITIEFDPDEMEMYLELTEKIGRMLGPIAEARGPDDLEDGPLKTLLIRRARLIGTARQKLSRLRELMTPLSDSSHNLVYCSDASSPPTPTAPGERQIAAVTRLLGSHLGMHINTYTSETSTAERAEYRVALQAGDLQALVAIRCLDEGVDIPEVRRAFILASSTNPRQFIQRRGRILRTSHGKDHAEIFDFIVSPDPGYLGEEAFEIERRLLRRELMRVVEFAGGARNGAAALASLLELRDRYHLLDVG